METTYSKSTLIAALALAAAVILVALWWLIRPPADEPAASLPPVLSDQAKMEVLQNLAASSNSSADIPVEKKEQVLQKAAPSTEESDAGPVMADRQMEILRSLRYSE